jgi:branched-chain amino acid transport system permease protein
VKTRGCVALIALYLALPWVFSSGLSVSLWAQVSLAVVACLSLNLLLGQGGMLSFGHAVYSGVGAFAAIHALKANALPVSLIPLAGGVAGGALAAVLGFVTTRRSAGSAFAMITLGLGELVHAAALMWPELFGGEAGVSANRAVAGSNWGSPLQVGYLLAVYAVVCAVCLYAYSLTPLGRLLNAVRENPERVEFTGYSAKTVRYLSFIVAGFFAGISGGMYALQFEIATPELLGTARSGAYLLFTFVGGVGVFYGPIVGAVLMVLATALLSEITRAWLLYIGLLFMWMVIFAPGGLAALMQQLLHQGREAARQGVRFFTLWLLRRTPRVLCGAMALAGLSTLIEMLYHLQFQSTPLLHWWGLQLDVRSATSWGAAAIATLLGVCGAWLLGRTVTHFSPPNHRA